MVTYRSPLVGMPSWCGSDGQPFLTAVIRALGMTEASIQDDKKADVVDSIITAASLIENHCGVGHLADFLDDDGGLPPQVARAVVIVAMEQYRRKEAAFGVLNGYTGSDFGPVRIGTDWLKPVESMLLPYIEESLGVG